MKYLFYTAVVIVIGFFLYLHYGIYEYDKLNQKTPVRINRFTGETELLQNDGSWKTSEELKKDKEKQKAILEQAAKKADENAPPEVSFRRYVHKGEFKSILDVKRITTALSINYTNYAKSTDSYISISWRTWMTDNITVTLNGTEIEDEDPVKEYFRKRIILKSGSNTLNVTLRGKTYSYEIFL